MWERNNFADAQPLGHHELRRILPIGLTQAGSTGLLISMCWEVLPAFDVCRTCASVLGAGSPGTVMLK